MIRLFLVLCALAFASLALGASPQLRMELVAPAYTTSASVFLTAPEGDSRLFVVRKGGVIHIVQNGTTLPTPFLDVSDSVNAAGERGLLGLAFDPGYATNRRF